MILKRDGFVAEFAYKVHKCPVPNRTNLCPVAWRLLGGLLLELATIVLALVVLVVLTLVMYLGAPVAVLLFGYKPVGIKRWMDNLGSSGGDPVFKRVERWPTIGGFHVMPAVILILLGIVGVFLWLGGKLLVYSYSNPISAIAVSFVIVLAAGVSYIKLRSAAQPNWWKLIKEIFRAFWGHVCPVVTFE